MNPVSGTLDLVQVTLHRFADQRPETHPIAVHDGLQPHPVGIRQVTRHRAPAARIHANRRACWPTAAMLSSAPGMWVSGHLEKALPSIESQPRAYAVRIRWCVFTRPIWTHSPRALAMPINDAA